MKTHANGKNNNIPEVNTIVRVWEDLVMEKREYHIEEDNIDTVLALKDLWETGFYSSLSTMGTDDNEDILQLSTLFDDNNSDSLYSSILNNSSMLEQQVINELALRIEEHFMLNLANEKSNAQDLENSCEIIHNVINKNPRSSIRKKLKFKNIANKVIQNTNKEKQHNDSQNNKKSDSIINLIKKLKVERKDVIKEDNINYTALKNIWEKGAVTGKGDDVSSEEEETDDEDDDDPGIRMLVNGGKSSSSKKKNSARSVESRGSIKQVMKNKRGNVNNLISVWSKNG